MKKITMFILSAALVCAVACSKKQEDPRIEVGSLVQSGDYQKAKTLIIGLRSNYPNDQKLIEYEKICDEKLAAVHYEKMWKDAETKNDYKEFIKMMIKLPNIENSNSTMKKEWIKKAADKAIELGEKQLNDEELLGMLKNMRTEYNVITENERLTLITKYVKAGRFPMKDWKDTFISKYSELMDDDGNFVGYPKPEKPATEAKKK